MNTHIDIELPPLPNFDRLSSMHADDVVRRLRTYGRECARAAIKADRKRRVNLVKSYLKVSYDKYGDCLYVVCDSNEPARSDEDEKGILYRYAESDGRLVGITILDFMGRHAESSDDAQRPAEPVKKKPYAQGSALGEFGIIPMCDQVNDEPVKVPSDAELLDLATLCGINHSVIDTDYCRAVELPEGTRHIADEVRPENTVAFARALLARYGKGAP